MSICTHYYRIWLHVVTINAIDYMFSHENYDHYLNRHPTLPSNHAPTSQSLKRTCTRTRYKNGQGERALCSRSTPRKRCRSKHSKCTQIKEEEDHTTTEATRWEEEVQGEWDIHLHSHGELLSLTWSLVLEVKPIVLLGLQFQATEFKARYITP